MCNVRYWTLEEETKREAKNSVVFLPHSRKYLSFLCSTIATSPKCKSPRKFLEIDKEFLPASIAGVEMCCSSVCNLFKWTRQLTIQLSGGGGAGQLFFFVFEGHLLVWLPNPLPSHIGILSRHLRTSPRDHE